jgi:hypothetical protein
MGQDEATVNRHCSCCKVLVHKRWTDQLPDFLRHDLGCHYIAYDLAPSVHINALGVVTGAAATFPPPTVIFCQVEFSHI